MAHHRGFQKRWKTNRLIEYKALARRVHVLYETAWADAWPHLDDWFKVVKTS